MKRTGVRILLNDEEKQRLAELARRMERSRCDTVRWLLKRATEDKLVEVGGRRT